MNLMRPLIRTALNHKNLYSIRYSRQYLRSLDVDQNKINQQQVKNLLQLKKQKTFNHTSNDRNPNNHVKVRMNHSLFNVSYYPQTKVSTCSIMEPEIRLPRKTISATRKYIITSIKKAKDALHTIKRLYVVDAINQLMSSNKKVAKLMIRTFWNLLDHAKQRGFDPMRLWVHGCLIGKTKRYFNVRYHAKGRGARQKRDFCRVQVILYEKQQDKFYSQLAEGKCPGGLANTIRKVLLQRQDTNYQTLTRYAYLTTSKGRQQASEIIQRKIDGILAKNKKEGVFVPQKQVRKQILAQISSKVKTDLNDLASVYSDEVYLQKREQLYKKNMGITD